MTDTPDIQLVDDRPENLKALKKMLSKQGYRMRTSLNGELALASAFESPPDLILLDIRMLDMDGYEVCRRLKADEHTRDIPVLFLSALHGTEDKVKAFAAGGADYIAKPFQEQEVLARVGTHLALSEAKKQLDLQNNQLQAFNQNLSQEITRRKLSEAKLAKEHAILNAVLDSSDSPIFSLDRDFCYTSFNRVHAAIMKALYGVEIEPGHNLLAYQTNEQDREIARLNLERTLQGEQVIESAYSGEEGCDRRYFEVLHNPIRDEAGDVVGVSVFARDITERKLAEESTQMSNSLLSSVIESPDNIIIFALDTNYNYLSFNIAHVKEMKKVYDVDIEIGRHILTYIPREDDRLKAVENYKRVLKGERFIKIEEYGQSNSRFWYELIFNPIFDNSHHVTGFTVFVTDISDRKRAEQALRASEKKFHTLFETMTEMAVLHEVVFDQSGQAINYRITDCNKAFTKTTEISRAEAIGKPTTEVYQSETAPYLKEYAQVERTGEPYEYTTYYAPMDKHFLISVVSPQTGQFATITTDITALKQIEAVVSAKNKELENYLFVASHDLRSPLVNIQGFSRRLQKQIDSITAILSECQVDNETKLSLEKISNKGLPKSLDFIFLNVAKMDTLINGLLQISRTGRVKMTVKKINMNKLIEKVVQAHSFQIEEFEATINIDDLPDCYGDKNLLNQIFSNIIANALKYRAKERPLTISMAAQVRYNRVVYSLKDSGTGIAGRYLEKIWDVFFRVDSQAAEAGEGIGLSLVKRIADKHKGRVWVESEINRGSTFFVELRNNAFSE